jgi:hypothetical protein
MQKPKHLKHIELHKKALMIDQFRPSFVDLHWAHDACFFVARLEQGKLQRQK